MRNIVYLIKKTKEFDHKVMPIVVLYAFMIAAIPFLTSFLSKFVIDELVDKRTAFIVGILMAFFVIGFFTQGLSPYVKSIYEPRIMGVREKFINLLNKKVMDMDYEYTENPDTGTKLEMAMRAVSDNMSGIEGMLNGLVGMIGNSVSILVYTVFIIVYKWWMFLLLVVFLFAQVMIDLAVKKYEVSRAEDMASRNRKKGYLYYVMGDFRNGKDIRLNKLSSYFGKKFEDLGKEVLGIQKDILRRRGISQSLESVFKAFKMVAIYFVLFYSFRVGEISVGQFSFYFSAIITYDTLMNQFVRAVIEMKKQSYFIDDFREFMALEEYTASRDDDDILIPEINEIELEHLSFSYPGTETEILKDVNLKITKGERIALVGLNGAGKTTLIKILCGFYRPSSGTIKINGTDIKKINRKSYIGQISALFQDYNFFSFSIKENIVGEGEADDERISRIVEDLNLNPLISKLPKGLDTTIYRILDKDGVEFSGGQSQRIAFARALYKKNSLILLDEPTAALDVLSETKLYEDFNGLTKGKTVLFISHRLASTKFCDRIVTLYDGTIDEVGSHDELLKKNGRYAELFKLQASKYLATE